MTETTIITIDVDEPTGNLIHDPAVCSGIITISGTDPYLYYICTSGHRSR